MKPTIYSLTLLLLTGCVTPSPSLTRDPPQPAALQWSSGTHYTGEVLNGQRHGHGTHRWPDGAEYTGDFRHDQRTGHGIFTWPSGARYEGEFLNGKRHGPGSFTWPDGSRYVGQFDQGEMHGQGTFYSAEKSVIVCTPAPREEPQLWDHGVLVETGPATPPSPILPPAGELDNGSDLSSSPPPPVLFPNALHSGHFSGILSRRLTEAGQK